MPNEEDSESLVSEEDHSAQIGTLLKGKAQVAADFQVQTQKPRNKPNHKKRREKLRERKMQVLP